MSDKRALKISTDGTVTDIVVDGLREMQAVVEGLIAPISMHDGTMYVNDEGLLDGLDFNPVASALYGGILVGNALVLGLGDRHGNETHVTKACRERVLAEAAKIRQHEEREAAKFTEQLREAGL